MISIQNLNKRYGAQTLFEDVNLIVEKRERLGLIGRNGHGKSTLLKILSNQEPADSGSISIASDLKLGYLEQHLEFNEKHVLAEVAKNIQGYSTSSSGHDADSSEDYKAKKILSGLGFSDEDMLRPASEFSGGFQIRIQLAGLLVSEPDLILLDEPTNYLDIVSIRWLENFLKSWPGSLMLVTHDRSFMDRVCTHTAIIHRAKIKKFRGDTSKVYETIAEQEDIYQRTAENQRKRQEETMKFVERFRAKASKAKQVQSRIKALEREGQLAELQDIAELEFSFPFQRFQGKRYGKAEELSFSFDGERQLFEKLSFTIGTNDRIAVVGQNGTGKTTLLEVIAGGLKPQSGNLSFHGDCELGYYGQTNIDRLEQKKSIVDEILSVQPEGNLTRSRSIAGAMMFSGDLAEKKIEVLSGGERARVLLGKLIAKPSNLLLLDEPTHHLDFYSVETLIEALEAFPGAAIFVTHDENFLRQVATRLIVFDRGTVELFEGGYDDFLNRTGWSSERELNKPVTSDGEKRLSKKELRRLRAELLSEKATELGPLEKKVSSLENEIAELESSYEKKNEELMEITKTGYGDEAVKLSREIHQTKELIEERFLEFEELEGKRSELAKVFEERLAALED